MGEIPLNWNNIDTVLLDMDGTLLDLHFDNVFWLEWVPTHYAKLHDLTVPVAKQQLYAQFAQQHGQLNWYCVDYWTEALGLDIAELKKELVHLIQIRPQVEHFLSALKKHGKKIYLVTNAHHKSVQLKMDKTGLTQYFDAVITSHQFGVPKEHAAFWPLLKKQINFNEQRTLFIDDSVAVLNSAKQFGIKVLLAIAQPDSKRPAVYHEEYFCISSFGDITPP